MTSSPPSFNSLAILRTMLRFNIVLCILGISRTNALPLSDLTETQGRAIEDRFWVAQYDKKHHIVFQKGTSVRHKQGFGAPYDDYDASPVSEEEADAGLLRGDIHRTKVSLPIKPTVDTTVTKVRHTKIRRKKTKAPYHPSLEVLLDRPKLLAQLNAVLGDISAIALNCV